MSISNQVEAIARPIVEKSGAFIVETIIRGENRGKVLEMFIDTDEGVTSDHCVMISRELSQALDAVELIRGSYHLVVSSPGLDRPLKFPRQYPKNIGRKMTVRCHSQSTNEILEGQLIESSSNSIVLRLDGNDDIRRIAFEDIIEARVRTAW